MPEVAQATITVTPVMAGAQETITNELSSAADPAGSAAGAAIGKSMNTSLSEQLCKTGGALTKGVTAPLTAGAVAGVAAWKEVDSGLDTIIKKTGASGDSLDEMHQILNNITTSVPVGFETAGAAIGEVNTRFGVTGEELESLSTQFIKFAELNDQDVSTSVDSVSKMLAAFGMDASEAGYMLDALNVVGQQTGVDVGQLSDTLAANAAQLQEMGLSAEDAAALLGSMSMAGLDSSTAMMGLKTAMKNATEDGITLDEALAGFQETMQSNASETEKLQAAYELFGTRGGAAIENAVSNGELNLSDFTTSLGEFEGSVNSTFEGTLDPMDEFQTTLNELKILGAEIVESAGPALSDILSTVASVVKTLADAWNSLSPEMQDFIIKAGMIAAAVGPVMVGVGKIAGAFSTIKGVFSSGSNVASSLTATGNAATAATQPVSSAAGAFGSMAGQALKMVAAAAALYIAAQAISVLVDAAIRITEAGGPAIAVLVGMGVGIVGLMAAAAALGPALTAGAIGIGVFGAAMLGIGAGIDLACQGIAKVTDSISNLVSTISSNAPSINSIVTNIGTTVSGVIETISSGIVSVIDAISGGISGVLDSLSGVIDSIGQAALNAGTGFEKLANAIINLTNNTGVFDLGSTLAAVAVGVGKITSAASDASSAAASVSSLTSSFNSLKTAGMSAGAGMMKFSAQTKSAMTIAAAAFRSTMMVMVAFSASARAAMSSASSSFNLARTAAQAFASGVRSSMMQTATAINGVKSALASFASSVQSSLSTIATAFRTLNLASGIRSAMNEAISEARSGISRLESAFSSAHFSFYQHIKVPHFSMSGSFNAETGSVPRVSTSWYKVAESQPYLFNRATIFGAGESNDEMLYGRDRLLQDIALASGNADRSRQMNMILRMMDGIYQVLQDGQTITIGKRDFARLVNEVS